MSSPTVSVVVPVYNDPEGVRMTLESVTNQTYPVEDYEIVVVNNNSDDGTQGVIEEFCERYPEQVRLVVEETQGLFFALNTGIEATYGEILSFIDADMTVDVDWLETVTQTLIDGNYDYMGCPVETYPPSGRKTLATKFDSQSWFRMEEYMEESNFTGSGCLTVRREVIDAVGKFDTEVTYGADKEFGKRVHAAGFDQHFEPSITMYHPARSSIIEHLEKSFRTGRGMRELHDTHPNLFETYSPFRLRSYLPISPRWFYTHFSDKGEFSMRELVGLYLLSSLKKFVKYSGSFYEYLKNETTTQ